MSVAYIPQIPQTCMPQEIRKTRILKKIFYNLIAIVVNVAIPSGGTIMVALQA